MNKDQNLKNQVQKSETGTGKNRNLILYNDDSNTFDYVISCLIEVCEHDVVQAEQCAFITHYKGKCDIKKGEYKWLQPLKENLVEKGLRVTID